MRPSLSHPPLFSRLLLPPPQVAAFLDRFSYKNPKKRAVDAYAGGARAALAAAAHAALTPAEELRRGYAILQGTEQEGGGGGAASGAAAQLAAGLARGSSLMQRRAAKHGRASTDAPATSEVSSSGEGGDWSLRRGEQRRPLSAAPARCLPCH